MRLFDQACGPDESASVRFFAAWSMNSLIESFLFEVREIKTCCYRSEKYVITRDGLCAVTFFPAKSCARVKTSVKEKLMLVRHAEHWTSEGLLLVLHKGTIRV